MDKSNPVPLYYQLVEIIRKQIVDKELKPGDKLSTEQWYSEKYSISRVTVRRAISELILSGEIERVRGKGPVVANARYSRKFSKLTGLFEELRNSGITPSSKVVKVDRINAYGHIAQKLNVMEGEPLLYLSRIRYADKQPLAEQKLFLREKYCKGLDLYRLGTESLFSILEEEYGLKIEYADQTLSVAAPTSKQASLLDIDADVALMKMVRISYLNSGDSIEYTEMFYVSERYELSMRLYR